MRRPRHLSNEERALWDRVADTAMPLNPARVIEEPAKAPVPRPIVREIDPIQHFMMGEKAHGLAVKSGGARLAIAPLNMDNKAYGKMTRGKLKPEARIDLHGLTMAEAHPELVAFILGSHAIGRRLVLVITGKGKLRDDGGRQGILRHQVPQWMALQPLASAILQVTPAHLNHGGHGAYYVYLRRNR